MYDRVRPFFLLAVVLFLTVSLSAQVHGVPASVSSFGFGGNFSPAPGVPASVASLGPRGFAHGPALFGNCCFNASRFGARPPVFMGRHRGNRRAFFPVAIPAYSVPYTPVYLVQPDAAYDDEDDQGGPTIFDRRGTGTPRMRESIAEQQPPPAVSAAVAPPEPVAPQPSTLLVFKDGHQSEVLNYAIVGDTLFNLSEGRSYKILLADLDLSATRKANADHGVDFQLPPGSAR